MTDDATTQDTCPCCGDELDLHVGGKPCVGTYTQSYAERRAQAVRDQERKRIVRLFGEDAAQAHDEKVASL